MLGALTYAPRKNVLFTITSVIAAPAPDLWAPSLPWTAQGPKQAPATAQR